MIGAIVHAGWMNLRRDRAALMLSFVVPIVFFSIFAGIFGAQRSQTPTTKVAVADEDRTPQSRQLIDALQHERALKMIPCSGTHACVPFDAKSAEAFVRAGSAPVALVIPKGFAAAPIRFGGPAEGPAFRVLADSSDPIAPQVVSGLLQKTIFTAMPDTMMTAGVDAIDRYGGSLTPQQKQSLQQNIDSFRALRQRDGGRQAASSGSLVRIEVSDILGEKKRNPVVALYAAGIGVMFLLFSASNAGGALLEENESGTLDRILTTRVSFTTLLFGKLLYVWALGLCQLIVMFVWGALVFHLELAKHLGGFLIMAVATSLATSAFGLLIASVAKTRQQLGAISTLTVLTISALGGSMFPRFLMPESMQKFGLVLFNAWALDGLTNVFWRDAPLSTLIVPVAVLLAWAVGFFAAARQMTRRWVTA